MAETLTEQHVWGCPVYILDARLQDRSGSVPKWDLRAALGLYLGPSSVHASNAHLVLSPRTGYISPQYHVVFDNTFPTVPHFRSGTVPALWKELVELNGADLKGTLPENTWELPDKSSSTIPPSLNLPSNNKSNNEVIQPPSQPINKQDTSHVPSQIFSLPPAISPPPIAVSEKGNVNPKGEQQWKQDLQMPNMIDLFSTGLRLSTRIKRAPERFSFFTMLLGAPT
eukprot:7168846-Ditylum_brightwellii.AAC.1